MRSVIISLRSRAPDVNFKCKICHQEFPGFTLQSDKKNTQHGFPTRTTNVDPDKFLNKVEVDHTKFKQELQSCQLFIVDSQFKRASHKTINYAKENLNATKVTENSVIFSII